MTQNLKYLIAFVHKFIRLRYCERELATVELTLTSVRNAHESN